MDADDHDADFKVGSQNLFREVFQETGSGDFGIQVANGPLFRCHTHILQRSGGFIGKVRQYGKHLPREVDPDTIPDTKAYFKEKGYTQLLPDLQAIQFSQPIERSNLLDPLQMLKNPNAGHSDPKKPGWSTAHFIGGTTAAMKRPDPFFLAERYKVECDCERMTELIRFVYCGRMSFFDAQPSTDFEKDALTDKMINLCVEAEKFSVDRLYEKLLQWFGFICFPIIGDQRFANAFYHLQHFESAVTEEFSRLKLIKTVTGDMLSLRDQFGAVTRDPRWRSLPVEFVEDTLNAESMPISSETEVLGLIERWNANADKKKEHIIRLLCCFRPSPETQQVFMSWLVNCRWITPDGKVPDIPELSGLKKILKNMQNPKRKPRNNVKLPEPAYDDEDEYAIDEEAQGTENDLTFIHYKGEHAVATGCSFGLGAQQRLVAAEPIRGAGITRMRILLSNPRKTLWNPEHEVFAGLSYGQGKYFGYLCSATAFDGIFSVRALASAAPAPNAPAHLTGSGNKVEFDLGLEVQVQRANMVVVCKLSVMFANFMITEEQFQIAYETLAFGQGLRFQVVGTGLGDEEIDIQLAWVGGGGPSYEVDIDTGPLDFE